MTIHIGTFPKPWFVGLGDLHYSDAQGREFAVTCHVTPGASTEVIALIKRGGVWAWDAYLDDYVDGHFAAQDNDMGKYMQWLAGRLSAWLVKTWPAGWTPPAPGAVVDPGGEPIDRIHAMLGSIKIVVAADGTLKAEV